MTTVEPDFVDDEPGTSSALGDAVATAVITAAIAPFVQTFAAKAAEKSYAAARDWLRRQFRTQSADDDVEVADRALLIVRDHDPRLDMALYLSADIPNEAIQALARLDLEKATAATGLDPVTKVRVYWDEAERSWQVERSRRRGSAR
jgi:alcohol dehydrogenase class IV